MVQLNFDATQHEPATGAAPTVPTDWYTLIIVRSDSKATKDKTGEFLELTCRIVEGQYTDRELTNRLNMRNKSKQAVDIANAELSAICHCIGVPHVQTSEQLHGIPFRAHILEEPRADNPSLNGNRFIGYMTMQGQIPQRGMFQQASPPQQQMGYIPQAAPVGYPAPSGPTYPQQSQPPGDFQGQYPVQPGNYAQPPQQGGQQYNTGPAPAGPPPWGGNGGAPMTAPPPWANQPQQQQQPPQQPAPQQQSAPQQPQQQGGPKPPWET